MPLALQRRAFAACRFERLCAQRVVLSESQIRYVLAESQAIRLEAAMTSTRTETDSFGLINVPANRMWGAQIQCTLMFFAISTEQIPRELLLALAAVKRAAASVIRDLGKRDAIKANAVMRAAEEIMAGEHAEEFPLSVWQTGSGKQTNQTNQTNMNMNEVLVNRASQLLGGVAGKDRLLHPSDDVNLGQSSNDILTTAMLVAAIVQITQRLRPTLQVLRQTLQKKSHDFEDIVKIGRAHL